MPKASDLPQVAETLGRRIRERRLELGLTQAQLAERSAGIEPNYVGRVERGEKNISVALLVAVGRALDTTASSLLEGVE